jgi:hypothetical protein
VIPPGHQHEFVAATILFCLWRGWGWCFLESNVHVESPRRHARLGRL